MKYFKEVEAKDLKGGETFGLNGYPIGTILSVVIHGRHVHVEEEFYEPITNFSGKEQYVSPRTCPLDFIYQVF